MNGRNELEQVGFEPKSDQNRKQKKRGNGALSGFVGVRDPLCSCSGVQALGYTSKTLCVSAAVSQPGGSIL